MRIPRTLIAVLALIMAIATPTFASTNFGFSNSNFDNLGDRINHEIDSRMDAMVSSQSVNDNSHQFDASSNTNSAAQKSSDSTDSSKAAGNQQSNKESSNTVDHSQTSNVASTDRQFGQSSTIQIDKQTRDQSAVDKEFEKVTVIDKEFNIHETNDRSRASENVQSSDRTSTNSQTNNLRAHDFFKDMFSNSFLKDMFSSDKNFADISNSDRNQINQHEASNSASSDKKSVSESQHRV